MRTRQMKSWLWIGSAAMGIAAVGVLVMAWVMPYAEAEPDAVMVNVKHAPKAAHDAVASTVPTAGDPVWGTSLRRPLVEPPKPTATAETRAQAPPLTAKLTGTVIEQGRSLAMFITAAGKVELKGVGESIEGAQVKEITDRSVRLEHNGRTITMALPKKEGA